jgi:hypothetical protein
MQGQMCWKCDLLSQKTSFYLEGRRFGEDGPGLGPRTSLLLHQTRGLQNFAVG